MSHLTSDLAVRQWFPYEVPGNAATSHSWERPELPGTESDVRPGIRDISPVDAHSRRGLPCTVPCRMNADMATISDCGIDPGTRNTSATVQNAPFSNIIFFWREKGENLFVKIQNFASVKISRLKFGQCVQEPRSTGDTECAATHGIDRRKKTFKIMIGGACLFMESYLERTSRSMREFIFISSRMLLYDALIHTQLLWFNVIRVFNRSQFSLTQNYRLNNWSSSHSLTSHAHRTHPKHSIDKPPHMWLCICVVDVFVRK